MDDWDFSGLQDRASRPDQDRASRPNQDRASRVRTWAATTLRNMERGYTVA